MMDFSLAWACVVDLTKRIKCLCLFATHYFELTELGSEPGIDNYHVTAQELNGNLILLHKSPTRASKPKPWFTGCKISWYSS